VRIVQQTLSNLEIGEKILHRNLDMFPLFTEKKSKFDYITLDEALSDNTARITEASKEGVVPKLRVITPSLSR